MKAPERLTHKCENLFLLKLKSFRWCLSSHRNVLSWIIKCTSLINSMFFTVNTISGAYSVIISSSSLPEDFLFPMVRLSARMEHLQCKERRVVYNPFLIRDQKVKTDCVTARWRPVEIWSRRQTDESAAPLHIPVTPSERQRHRSAGTHSAESHQNVCRKLQKTTFKQCIFPLFKEMEETSVCHSVRHSGRNNTLSTHLTEVLSGSTLSCEADSLTGLRGWVSACEIYCDGVKIHHVRTQGLYHLSQWPQDEWHYETVRERRRKRKWSRATTGQWIKARLRRAGWNANYVGVLRGVEANQRRRREQESKLNPKMSPKHWSIVSI